MIDYFKVTVNKEVKNPHRAGVRCYTMTPMNIRKMLTPNQLAIMLELQTTWEEEYNSSGNEFVPIDYRCIKQNLPFYPDKGKSRISAVIVQLSEIGLIILRDNSFRINIELYHDVAVGSVSKANRYISTLMKNGTLLPKANGTVPDAPEKAIAEPINEMLMEVQPIEKKTKPDASVDFDEWDDEESYRWTEDEINQYVKHFKDSVTERAREYLKTHDEDIQYIISTLKFKPKNQREKFIADKIKFYSS